MRSWLEVCTSATPSSPTLSHPLRSSLVAGEWRCWEEKVSRLARLEPTPMHGAKGGKYHSFPRLPARDTTPGTTNVLKHHRATGGRLFRGVLPTTAAAARFATARRSLRTGANEEDYKKTPLPFQLQHTLR